MDKLNESCYAFPAIRKFPINTEESAISSFGTYKMQKNAFTEAQQEMIEGNFKKAAAYYGIALEHTEPEPAPRTVLMFKGASEHVDMNEITTKEELDKAIDFILEKRASTPRAVLAEPAKYILWSAANTDVDMTTDRFRKIAHIAGIGVGDREKIEYEFDKRATLNVFGKKDREEFWKYASEMKSLSDEDFYKEATLNAICDMIDNIDFMYNNQHKHASELGYPEDVVFADTIDDLMKSASDLYYVPSVDATMSKKATFERENAINSFFKAHFEGYEPLSGDTLIEKIASLDKNTANALIETIE